MSKQHSDPYDLNRFVEAQARDYAQAISELRAGRKRTHWMWYILPQLKGLGLSQMALFYGIGSAAEARAYLAHPILGPRLIECVETMNRLRGLSAPEVLGEIDAMKFRSCLTLFAAVSAEHSIFQTALDNYFGGVSDDATLARLAAPGLPIRDA
jgi:uncharacterized protein (DUF1810 family)